MLEDTLKRIDDAVRRVESSDSEHKEELLALLSSLKSEIERLSRTHGEQARSIAGFTDVAAHEATRKERSANLLDHSLEGLALSAKDFETSHPQLVDTINRICTMLARIGI